MSLAQGIDRGICHLGEALLAVIPNRTPHRRKKCWRRVVAHAPYGFFRLGAERFEEQTILIATPAESGRDAFRFSNGILGRILFGRAIRLQRNWLSNSMVLPSG